MRSRPQLRRYQREDLDDIEQAHRDVRAVCYQAPTGSGKGVLICELLHRTDQAGQRALVLGHRQEIVDQISDGLDACGVRHGIIAPDYPQTEHRIQVGSVMTVVRRLDWLRSTVFHLAVIDEAHHAAAATWLKILAALSPDCDVLGTTATPRRLDGKPLDDIFEELIVGPSISRLTKLGYLAPCTVFTPPTDLDLSNVKTRAGDYAVDELSTVMSRGVIIEGACSEYERLCRGVPAIAFCVTIEHSKLVMRAFADRGWRAAHVDGHTPRDERRALIKALATGKLDILCNCGLISEGLDVPGVIACLLLRPTKSLALHLQQVGRALRPAPGKDRAIILDCAGNTLRHGLPTAHRHWSLHGRQQQASEEDTDLIRCSECGALNPRDADECEHCSAELHRHRERGKLIEMRAPPLVEAFETPDDDITAELHRMSLKQLLRWASDADGRIVFERAVVVGQVRGYKPGWPYYARGRHWKDVYEGMVSWAATHR